MCHVFAQKGREGYVLGLGLICLLGQVLRGAGADTINLMLHANPPSNFTGHWVHVTDYNSYGKSPSAICFYTSCTISCYAILCSLLVIFELHGLWLAALV